MCESKFSTTFSSDSVCMQKLLSKYPFSTEHAVTVAVNEKDSSAFRYRLKLLHSLFRTLGTFWCRLLLICLNFTAHTTRSNQLYCSIILCYTHPLTLASTILELRAERDYATISSNNSSSGSGFSQRENYYQ